MSGDGELMLTILASFAQEESRSLSENVKWGIRKRFEKGDPCNRNPILGYEWVDDKLVVVPEEAEIVKRIFRNFLDGKSRLETERELNAEGYHNKERISLDRFQYKGYSDQYHVYRQYASAKGIHYRPDYQTPKEE